MASGVNVGTAIIDIKIDNSGLLAQINKMKSDLNGIKGSKIEPIKIDSNKTIGELNKIRSALRGLASIFGAIGGAISGFGFKAVNAFLKSGTPEARSFQHSLDMLQASFAKLGARILQVNVAGNTISGWINSASNAINNISDKTLSASVNFGVFAVAFAAITGAASMVIGSLSKIGKVYKDLEDSSKAYTKSINANTAATLANLNAQKALAAEKTALAAQALSGAKLVSGPIMGGIVIGSNGKTRPMDKSDQTHMVASLQGTASKYADEATTALATANASKLKLAWEGVESAIAKVLSVGLKLIRFVGIIAAITAGAMALYKVIEKWNSNRGSGPLVELDTSRMFKSLDELNNRYDELKDKFEESTSINGGQFNTNVAKDQIKKLDKLQSDIEQKLNGHLGIMANKTGPDSAVNKEVDKLQKKLKDIKKDKIQLKIELAKEAIDKVKDNLENTLSKMRIEKDIVKDSAEFDKTTNKYLMDLKDTKYEGAKIQKLGYEELGTAFSSNAIDYQKTLVEESKRQTELTMEYMEALKEYQDKRLENDKELAQLTRDSNLKKDLANKKAEEQLEFWIKYSAATIAAF